MKIEIDTQKDSKTDIEKVITLLKDIVLTKGNDFDLSKEKDSMVTFDKDFSKPNLSNTEQKNDDVIMPSKEDLLAYKKGKYSPPNVKDSKSSTVSFKEDKNSDDEPKIEVY